MPSLLRTEARERAALLDIDHYRLHLDLREEATFASTTVIDFTSAKGTTFLDLKAVALHRIALDGAPLPLERWREGRYNLDLEAGPHRLEVEATMRFRNDGEGLHRATDPVDGATHIYQMSFMSAAPSVYACFDQPDLKARYSVEVLAPVGWQVTGNGTPSEVEPGRWHLSTTEPLSTYFVCVVAGEYHRLESSHDGIPLGLYSRRSLARALEADAEEILAITTAGFDEFHRLFGIRYPFGGYDQVFVPEFNAGAMENPGCVTFRDPLLFTTRVPRSLRIQRATTIAHEMAHQWFGNLVTPRWWDDLWLNEAFAEYMGNRVTAEVTEFDDALVWATLTRKNWGLCADSRPTTHPVAGTEAPDADTALQDFDGISYAKGHAVLTQLAAQVGDEVFFAGVREHFARHRFGNATMHDLFGYWAKAGAVDLGGQDLDSWTKAWLRTAGLDRIDLDRSGGLITVSASRPPDTARRHAVSLARWSGDSWIRDRVEVGAGSTPLAARPEEPILLDADGSLWADLSLDPITAAALPELFGRTTDPGLRATIWTTLRNGVHQARLRPRTAAAIAVAGIRDECADPALAALTVWAGDEGEGSRATVHEKLLPVLAEPEPARAALCAAFGERVRTAPAGSDLQVAALGGQIGTCSDPGQLQAILDGEAAEVGVSVDSAVRWRVLRRLTSLGHTDLDRLDAELRVDPDAKYQLSHAWCRARLADPEQKAWAWRHFTGENDASNYLLEAIGTGFWAADQAALLAPYAVEYLNRVPATTEFRSGWVLSDGALFFYPMALASADLADATERVVERPDLDRTLSRILRDAADQVRRRLAARRLDEDG